MGTEKRKTKGTPDSIDVHVGQRLKIKRSLLGLSQEKLAESIGLTFQQIQKYERGLNRISAGRLYEFARILEEKVPYFYQGLPGYGNSAVTSGLSDNEQEGFAGEEDVMNKRETLELIRIYYSIEDENMRKDIFKFIKSMAARNA